MINLITWRKLQLMGAAALLLAAGACQAQWMWIDEKGMKQASDRPPPASVPAKNILKMPMHTVIDDKSAVAKPPAAAQAAAPAPAAPASKGMTLAEREADYRKRMAAKAEQETKDNAQADVADKKLQACRAARANKANIESGVRLRTGEGRGEYMTDKERAEQALIANRVIEQACR